MKHSIRTKFVALAGALALVFVALPAAADVWTDKWEYTYGETVYIDGDGMWPGETVAVEVFYPDGALAQSHQVDADDEGNFSDTFDLEEGMPGGIYDVVATGLSSGNVFTTQFDPPTYSATLDSPTEASPASVDYSDEVTFSGTITCEDKSGSGNQCDDQSKSFTIAIQLKGGAGDFTTVTSEAQSFTFAPTSSTCPSGCTKNWSVTWQAGKTDALDQVDPGTYTVRARFTGTANINTPSSGHVDALEITKEETVTTYTGPSSGPAGGSVTVSATVEDEDASKFLDDSVFGGTVEWELNDATGASVITSTVTWDGTDENWEASETLSLAGVAPGNYTIETTFTPDASDPTTAATYYNGSSDSDAFEVTGASFFVEFLPPLIGTTGDGTTNKGRLGRIIPTKVKVYEGTDNTGTPLAGINETGRVTIRVVNGGFACSSGSPDNVDYYESAGSSNNGDVFRWSTDGHWIYNLDTLNVDGTNLKKNRCYKIEVRVDGNPVASQYALLVLS